MVRRSTRLVVGRCREVVMIAALISVALTAMPALAADDPFQEQYQLLRGQSTAEVGRDAIVDGYQKLIDAHPNDPRIADAMFNVGSLYENENPAIGMMGDPEKALDWYRKAAAAAAPGSEMWTKARQFVARRVQYTGADGIREADELFTELAQANQGNWNVLAQIELDLVSQSLRKEDPDEAQRHCLILLNWYQDPARIPTHPREKERLDRFIIGAAGSMIQAWCTVQKPREERLRRIQELFQQHMPLDSLKDEPERAMERIEQGNFRAEVSAEFVETAPASRKIVLVANLVGISLLAVFFCGRAYLRSRNSGAC